MVEAKTGRYRRSRPLLPGERPNDLALEASLKQAVLRQAYSRPAACAGGLIARQDFCQKVRYRPAAHLIVLAVDASDSMGQGSEARMKAAKGAILAILRKAYEHRSQAALIAFGGDQAHVVLPPTGSVQMAQKHLAKLPIGGATPFGDGLFKSWHMIQCARYKHPGLRSVLVVISDGEANVSLTEGLSAWEEVLSMAGRIRHEKVSSIFIDVMAELARPGAMRDLAAQAGAAYIHINELKPRHIVRAVNLYFVQDANTRIHTPG